MPIWGWILIGSAVIFAVSYVSDYCYRVNNEYYHYHNH